MTTPTTVPELQLHDLCEIMPPHTKEEFKELKEEVSDVQPRRRPDRQGVN